MFEDFRIRRLQEKIISRGRHAEQINKSIEELKELIEELELFKLIHQPFTVTDADLKKTVGNLQKEIPDVENILYKLKLLFVRTSAQRKAYKQGKRDIIYALREYLKRGLF